MHSNYFNTRAFIKSLKLFIPYLMKNKASKICSGIAIALILLDIVASSLVPYYSKKIVNTLSLDLTQSLGITVLLLGFFWTIEKINSHIQDIIFFPVINNCIRDLTRDVVEKVHRVPLTLYQTFSMSEILSCIRRISCSVRAFFKVLILLALPTLAKLCVAIFVALQFGMLSLMLIPVIMGSLFTLYKGMQWYLKARVKAWMMSDQVFMRVNDSISNTTVTRPFHDYEMSTIKETLDKEANLWYAANTRLHGVHILIGIVVGIGITLLYSLAIYAIQHQTLSVGDFVLLQGQLMVAILSLKTFSIEFRQLAESCIDISKIVQILECPEQQKNLLARSFVHAKDNKDIEDNREIEDNEKNENKKYYQDNTLRLNQLSFSYRESHNNLENHDTAPLFFNLNFDIQLGEKIVIQGKNGCGKSTLMALMAGLQIPSKGEVLLCGQNIHTLPPEKLSQWIHCIPQDLRLFNLSLYDNLTYGLKRMTSNDNILLEEMIESFNLSSIIQQLKKGFQTPLGEMGNRLSGGEKQRIALARALLLRPRILILDETLNSIAGADEITILKEIFNYIETVVIVSHRTFPLMQVDRVVELKDSILTTIVPQSKAKSELNKSKNILNKVDRANEVNEAAI